MKKILIPTIYVAIICTMIACVLLVIGGIKAFLSEEEKYEFTLDDVFDGEVLNVVKNESDIFVKPYLSDKVKIGKYFYDYKANKTKQESSIIMYENTYIQNQGVDYVSEEDFDVVSILSGEVVSIEDSEIYGKILTIKHSDSLKSIYYNLSNILVAVGYKASGGEIIATSSKSKIDSNDKSLLHFEVNYNEENIDPESVYSHSISEFE